MVADDELDTVSVTFVESSLQFKRDISDSDPSESRCRESNTLGLALTNEQGYTDGFQFEVRTTDAFVNVQLMCEATAFDVRLVISL